MIRQRPRIPVVSLSLAASIILLMSGCGTGAGLDNGPEAGGASDSLTFDNLDGNWDLVSATDSTGQFDLSGLKSHGGTADIAVTLSLTAGKLAGTAACNNYFGEFAGVPEALRVTNLGQTMMYCDDNGRMDLETRYLTALGSVTSAQLGSGVGLILLGDGVGLSFVPSGEKSPG